MFGIREKKEDTAVADILFGDHYPAGRLANHISSIRSTIAIGV